MIRHRPIPFAPATSALPQSLLCLILTFVSAGAFLAAQDSPPPVLADVPSGSLAKPLPAGVTRVALVFSGGHDTLPIDHGRPVSLIAAALGVQDQVFREAFSHVHPAGPGSGGPTDAEARANKQALMKALGKYGVTNDRLNTVSTFYRYPSWEGGIWKHQPATGNALVKDGAIIGYEITAGGYGYTTPPTVTVPAFKGAAAKVTLAFGPNFTANGSVAEIAIAPGA